MLRIIHMIWDLDFVHIVNAEINFFFAFVFSYTYLKNVTTLFFSIHLNRSLSLAKSLIQAKQFLSDSLRKNDILQKYLLLTPFRFLLAFKSSLVCCVHACTVDGKVTVKYHKMPAEMTCQQIPSYFLTSSENLVFLIGGERCVYRWQLPCVLQGGQCEIWILTEHVFHKGWLVVKLQITLWVESEYAFIIQCQ